MPPTPGGAQRRRMWVRTAAVSGRNAQPPCNVPHDRAARRVRVPIRKQAVVSVEPQALIPWQPEPDSPLERSIRSPTHTANTTLPPCQVGMPDLLGMCHTIAPQARSSARPEASGRCRGAPRFNPEAAGVQQQTVHTTNPTPPPCPPGMPTPPFQRATRSRRQARSSARPEASVPCAIWLPQALILGAARTPLTYGCRPMRSPCTP